MRGRWWLLVLLVVVAAKKKHRHQKPGRALLDRLSGTTVGDVSVTSDARSGELLPAPLDAAPFATIAANATCGDAGAEEYCRDTPGKRGVVCDYCEGPDGPPSRRHPPAHALDGDPATWWQSPTQAAGDFGHIALLATLPAKMELLHVIVKAGPSPRPLAWSLEVSSSEHGEDWRMVRAFGDREHCRKLWDLRPERRRRKARAARRTNRADKPTCSTQFVSPKPMENGEMHVGLGEGVSARRLRISFRAAHASVPRQQYYTVRELTIAARCICHGHARHCNVDHQGAKCDCEHGTCGNHCQRCCSGERWRPQEPCGEGRGECSCGERGACAYDDAGTILCVNCTENRAGPLCDRCLSGFYSVLPDAPCVPCDCDPEGSDGSCKWDRRHHQATCTCYPGFSGPTCSACEDPSLVFPACLPEPSTTTPVCKCDPRGVVDPARVCDDVCECKANVVGERCDACAPGHFGLSAAAPGGCTPCYCSHVTDSCVAATDVNPPLDVILPLGDAWMVTDSMGNETVEPSIDDQGQPFLVSYEVEGWELYYWVTHAWSGEHLDAYGGAVRARVTWGLLRGDTGGSPTIGPDVVLVGADGTKLAFANSSHSDPGQLTLLAPLVAGGWFSSEEPALAASRAQIMDVLADLKAIMIRAHFHFDQDEVRLESAEILARNSSELVEQCACGAGRSGAHCERCAWHHVRVAGQCLPCPCHQHASCSAAVHLESAEILARNASEPVEQCACGAGRAGAHCERCAWHHVRVAGQCLPCPCHQHASCNAVEGPCGECQHNTTGPHCERCLPGHYGNPVQGDCKPCACPLYLPSNNFSPNCALASAEGDDFVCTQCPDGYVGDHCESCDFGYWGSPTTPGGRCERCECGGSPCHPRTGACLTCPPHAEGARCDQCEEGYWFGESPPPTPEGTGVTCVACKCGAGALEAACDARSGQCACRPGWTERACDRCAPGHGGIESGCPLCQCGAAALNNECDPVTGACACSPGAAPPHCDTCLDGHYALNASGCLGCNCSKLGSESNACDIRTGQCRCRAHVTGRACDTCEEGYWGLQEGGCRRCECGAGAAACDPRTGLCACAAGVGGAQCDTCLPGYYGFGPAGCLPCPKCMDGKVCSAESGRCVCPPRSRGPGCRQCAPGYHAAPVGCSPCRCGPGATSNQCDPQSGQCKCKAGWVGASCDHCAAGHFGPRCRPCLCHEPGTRDCKDGVCTCDDEGRCPCKENVVGDKCDSCLNGTFGLSADNPSGCTACFCFGRAAHCTQAALTRAALHAARAHHVTVVPAARNVSVDENSLIAIPIERTDSTIAMSYPPVPIYVELDKRFLGDRVTSYGGALRFTVEEEGGDEMTPERLATFPLVRIEGNGIELDHYQRGPANNGTHAVRFHESLWQGGNRRLVASRPALMAALQRLDRVLLRLTTRAPTHDRVHALLLNVSLDTAIPGLSRSAPALGVELCECTRPYAAPSCQEPAVGFWMPPPHIHVSSVAGTIVINVQGKAQPCSCNGRATACDPKTGACVNCTGGTGGARCEVCAEGNYGSPDIGCQPCPCPTRAENYARACTLASGRLHCLCRPGYAGAECSECAVGWYRGDNGTCVECGCDPLGALSAACDGAGRCRCRPHAAGDKCDRCAAPRAYLHDAGDCRPCDNCTQTLLDSVEDLTRDLRTRADPTELSRIPKPFPALLEFAHNTSLLRTDLDNLSRDAITSKYVRPTIHDLEETEHRIFTEANRLKTEASTKAEHAHYLSLESMSGLEEVLKQRRKLAEQVAVLNEFTFGDKHLSARKALKEAKHLLRQIKDVRISDFLGGANDVFDSATLQSTAVQEYDYRLEDLQRRVLKLKAALEQWERKSEDLQRLGDIVWGAGDEVAAVEKRVKPKLSELRDTALRCRLVLDDIASLSPKNITDDVSSALLRAESLAIRFPSAVAELTSLMMAAEEKEGILYNLTPQYRMKYLEPVERHVAELNEKAKQYKMVFSGSRGAASLGVSAAHAWGGVASAVRDAAAAAKAATAAAAAAAATFSADTVPASAAQGKAASTQLKNRAVELLAKSNELRNRLESLRRAGDVVGVSLRALGWSERALGARPRAHVADTLQEAGARADQVFGTMRALYDEAAELRRRARYSLRRRLADLQRHGDTQLGAAQEHVSQIRGNTLRGAEAAWALAAAASARARDHAAADSKLRPSLAALRDTIARATHAAQSISVSLTSAGEAGCTRAYVARAASPAATRIAFTVAFSRVRDGPLLTLTDDNHENEKYIKLVVLNNQLRLSWELGGGQAAVTHPEILQPVHDDADATAYQVEIERIWNTVHLRVERLDGGSPLTVSNSSSPNAVQLTPRTLWLGAGEGGLPGCVSGLQLDGASVGLWAHRHQPPHALCTGCTMRWRRGRESGETGAAGGLVWFNGAGYAELRSGRRADRRHFSVAFTFRTTDTHALLFMAMDSANNRSVSVIMRDCRVVFLVQYSGARLEIVARGRHCTGRPQHVQAVRVFHDQLERGSLRVNGEETLGSAEPPVQSAADLPELAGARYWVGGRPPGAPGAAPPPLLGCLGALALDRDAYNLLDTPARHGLEPTCDNRVLRSALLEGSGYIELAAPAFKRRAALGLTFRTEQPGLLLYRPPDATSGDEGQLHDNHYLALIIVEGDLQVIAAAGKSELRLCTNGTKYDDGQLHTVRIVRAHKQLELWVDEALAASGALLGSARGAAARGLFVGGLPTALQNATIPTRPLSGTVADLIADGQLIGFESAVSWEGAALGRSGSASRPAPAPRPLHAAPATGCTKTSSYTVEAGAVKFGDAAGSHAALRVPPRARALQLQLHFRTFQPDGLLLVAPGSKAKPKHYLALMIREGKLKLVVRGRKRRELSLVAFVADGTWRSVTVSVSRSRVALSSGGDTARGAGGTIRMHRAYVGGLPLPPHAPKHLPPQITRVGGLIGCVRRLTLNGRPADLVRDHHAVGQCFPDVEQAAYFNGDAYASVSGVESGAEVRVRFRTFAPNGLLFAFDGLLLELRDGKVVLSRHSASGEGARAEAGGEGAACDGRWHVASVRAGALVLDSRVPVRLGALLLDPPLAQMPPTMYVGGAPEGSPEVPEGGRENFKGCISEVWAGGRARPWRELARHHVLLDSCPTR